MQIKIIKLLKNNIFLITLVLFASCDKKPMFEENKILEKNEWNFNDTISFEVNVNDTLNLKNLSLNIRNSSTYPYYNMFVYVDIKNEKGGIDKDTVEFYLANPISGKWTGNGSSGIHYNTILYKQVKFLNTGKYKISLTHGMRDTILEGINAIGFKVN